MKEVMEDATAFYGLDDKHNRQGLEQGASEVEERAEECHVR
nr:hypothetical protein [Achromobacter ruhlandii]